jgi:hypothetical protein
MAASATAATLAISGRDRPATATWVDSYLLDFLVGPEAGSWSALG